jgi:hypothetical protein
MGLAMMDPESRTGVYARTTVMKLCCVAFLASVATNAHAEIDDQCMQSWMGFASAEALGNKCNWINPAATQKLRASQDRTHACALARATDTEKADFEATYLPKTRDWIAKNFRDAPCDGAARQFFDGQAAQ